MRLLRLVSHIYLSLTTLSTYDSSPWGPRHSYLFKGKLPAHSAQFDAQCVYREASRDTGPCAALALVLGEYKVHCAYRKVGPIQSIHLELHIHHLPLSCLCIEYRCRFQAQQCRGERLCGLSQLLSLPKNDMIPNLDDVEDDSYRAGMHDVCYISLTIQV